MKKSETLLQIFLLKFGKERRERKTREHIMAGLTFQMLWSLINLTCFSKNAEVEKQKVKKIQEFYNKYEGYECVNFKSSDIKFWDEIYTIVESCTKDYSEIATMKNEEKCEISILDKYTLCCLIVGKIPIVKLLQVKELVRKSAIDYVDSNKEKYSILEETYIVKKLWNLNNQIFSEPYFLEIATGVSVSHALRMITRNGGIFFFP